jgi:hypothetical protein
MLNKKMLRILAERIVIWCRQREKYKREQMSQTGVA